VGGGGLLYQGVGRPGTNDFTFVWALSSSGTNRCLGHLYQG
jgi:hypothetical protein